MKIKQVEELVGITSRNIRFYENQGLLSPDRADNGYREYHQKEIDVLKKIKLLRKLGVPVEEIKKVLEQSISLDDCLEKQLLRLEKDQKDLQVMQNLAESIRSRHKSMDTLEIDKWLESMEELEKEGTTFVNLRKEDIHMKKKAGAYFGGAVMIALMLCYVAFMVWAYLTQDMPFGVLLLMIVIPVVIIAGIAVALKSRIKEIEGGEEDEASKY